MNLSNNRSYLQQPGHSVGREYVGYLAAVSLRQERALHAQESRRLGTLLTIGITFSLILAAGSAAQTFPPALLRPSARSRPITAFEKLYSEMLSPRHTNASIAPMISSAGFGSAI